MSEHPTPYCLRVDEAVLQDLAERLAGARWPDEPAHVPPWTTGTGLADLRALVGHWRECFDWRAHEAALNALPQFTLPIGGVTLHFIHERGTGPAPMPLLLSHGWPGSVFEFLKIIPMLTDPARHGGDAQDAFTVVAPSLPGFGPSFTPGQPRLGVEAMVTVFADLMRQLGYPRFGAQGGDWGSFVTTLLALRHADRLTGIHLNMLPLRRDASAHDTPTNAERAFAKQASAFMREHAGYHAIQGTRPQTLAYALTDSPVGLAAWMTEKFRNWSDSEGRADSPGGALSPDEVLAHVTLYWATGAIGSSFWPYYASQHAPWPLPAGATIDVPTGVAMFPHELLQPPRSIAERLFVDVRRWAVMPQGGHFAAQEQPEALAAEIRAFFRPLRQTAPH